MTGPRIAVCAGPLDTAESRWLLSRTDIAAGRVAVNVKRHDTPNGAPVRLLGEVLDVLGVTGQQRLRERPDIVVDHILPWLRAYDVRELIVHGYARLPTVALDLLLDVAAAAG